MQAPLGLTSAVALVSNMPLEPHSFARRLRRDSEAGAISTSTGGLVVSARLGDSRALNHLFNRYLPRLRSWASGRLPRWARDISDTVDLVQEAILNTLRRFDRFEPRGRGTLETYLRKAVLNNVYLEHRRAAARPCILELEAEMPDGDARAPIDRLIGEDAARRYAAALHRLSPTDQQIIVARLRMKCTFEQLAMLLGKSTSDAARVALKRALGRLAAEMKRV
jgi:RNA polymerase sigma-70 factor, ECF subfamily